MDAICGWLERFDVLVVGPGLGRDPWVQETVTQARLTVQSAVSSLVEGRYGPDRKAGTYGVAYRCPCTLPHFPEQGCQDDTMQVQVPNE